MASGHGKHIVYYDGGAFPFNDNQFDYVICSHVIEHVHNIDLFFLELFRVAARGYLEYPLAYYEYDIPEHINIFKRKGSELFWTRKNNILDQNSRRVREFWFNTLNRGYTENVRALVPLIMEGFEFNSPFKIRESSNLCDLIDENIQIPMAEISSSSIFYHLRVLRSLLKTKLIKCLSK